MLCLINVAYELKGHKMSCHKSHVVKCHVMQYYVMKLGFPLGLETWNNGKLGKIIQITGKFREFQTNIICYF